MTAARLKRRVSQLILIPPPLKIIIEHPNKRTILKLRYVIFAILISGYLANPLFAKNVESTGCSDEVVSAFHQVKGMLDLPYFATVEKAFGMDSGSVTVVDIDVNVLLDKPVYLHCAATARKISTATARIYADFVNKSVSIHLSEGIPIETVRLTLVHELTHAVQYLNWMYHPSVSGAEDGDAAKELNLLLSFVPEHGKYDYFQILAKLDTKMLGRNAAKKLLNNYALSHGCNELQAYVSEIFFAAKANIPYSNMQDYQREWIENEKLDALLEHLNENVFKTYRTEPLIGPALDRFKTQCLSMGIANPLRTFLLFNNLER